MSFQNLPEPVSEPEPEPEPEPEGRNRNRSRNRKIFVRFRNPGLKATKTKVNKIFQSDKMSSYTVTINAGNWIKENPQVTDTTKAIVRNVKI